MHELNFIKHKHKGLPDPIVLFRPLDNVSGYYCAPWDGYEELPWIEGEDPWANPNGLIVVSSLFPDEVDAILAHEWRHHWQTYRYGLLPEWDWITTDDYEYDYWRYFQIWHESDAFWFECKHTNTPFKAQQLDYVRPSWYEPKKYSI